MKKKLITLTSCTALSLALLCSCGASADKYADSKYTGTWAATTAVYAGMTLDAEQVFDEFTLTLDPSGKATANVNGEEEFGDWEETDSGVKLTDDSEQVMDFTADGSALTIEQDGVLVTFEQVQE